MDWKWLGIILVVLGFLVNLVICLIWYRTNRHRQILLTAEWKQSNLEYFVRTITNLTRKINQNPQDSNSYFKRGTIYYLREEYQKAINDYTTAIRFSPGYATAYVNRAVAYSHLGNHQQTISDCNKAISLNPVDAMAYHNRGLAYLRLFNKSKGRRDLQTASFIYLLAGNFGSRKGIQEKLRSLNQII